MPFTLSERAKSCLCGAVKLASVPFESLVVERFGDFDESFKESKIVP
jgi:hypothetical protein